MLFGVLIIKHPTMQNKDILTSLIVFFFSFTIAAQTASATLVEENEMINRLRELTQQQKELLKERKEILKGLREEFKQSLSDTKVVLFYFFLCISN